MNIINMLHKRQFFPFLKQTKIQNPYPLIMEDGSILMVPWRRSKRAWHITIRINQKEGVHVVIPWSCAARHAVSFLEERRDWIKKERYLLEEKIKNAPAEKPKALPESFLLPYTEERWKLLFQKIESEKSISPKLKQYSNELLVISGTNLEEKGWIKCIEKWLSKKAKKILPQLLIETAASMTLTPKKIAIRCQKTRWGSCAADGTISLNAKLLFFPEHLVKYILIHELCHLVHHNHGEHFWKMVSRFEPDYRQKVKEVREIQSSLPWWIY
jgi:predicted metal-dependent hydrolase